MNRRTFSKIFSGVFAAIFVTPFIPDPLQVQDKILIDLKEYRKYLMNKIVPIASDSIYIPIRPCSEDDVDIMIESAQTLNEHGGFIKKIDTITVEPFSLEPKTVPPKLPSVTIAATAQVCFPKLTFQVNGLTIPYTTTLPLTVLRRA